MILLKTTGNSGTKIEKLKLYPFEVQHQLSYERKKNVTMQMTNFCKKKKKPFINLTLACECLHVTNVGSED